MWDDDVQAVERNEDPRISQMHAISKPESVFAVAQSCARVDVLAAPRACYLDAVVSRHQAMVGSVLQRRAAIMQPDCAVWQGLTECCASKYMWRWRAQPGDNVLLGVVQ